MANAAYEHAQAMAELRSRLDREHQAVLEKVKDKYLTTLRAMRENAWASKERGVQRLQDEWRHREDKLEREWTER